MAAADGANAPRLQETLAAESGIVAELIEALKEEQAALARGETEALPSLAERKSALFVRLNALTARRSALLAADGCSPDRAGMEAWRSAHPAAAQTAADWARLVSLAEEAREMNRVNGEIIRMRLQFNGKALEVLRIGQNSLDLYGPDGHSRSAGGKRIVDIA